MALYCLKYDFCITNLGWCSWRMKCLLHMWVGLATFWSYWRLSLSIHIWPNMCGCQFLSRCSFTSIDLRSFESKRKIRFCRLMGARFRYAFCVCRSFDDDAFKYTHTGSWTGDHGYFATALYILNMCPLILDVIGVSDNGLLPILWYCTMLAWIMLCCSWHLKWGQLGTNHLSTVPQKSVCTTFHLK